MKFLFTSALLFLLCIAGTAAFAQVGIGTISPATSAALDVVSADKGVLIPRMDKSTRDNISSPATGLLIYQTNQTPGFYFFDGSAWKLVGAPAFTGFSAATSGQVLSTSGALTAGWSLVSSSGGYNPTTGIYTVPADGLYQISATVNFAHAFANSISMGSGVNPNIQVRKVQGSAEVLRGVFPMLDVNVVLVLTLRTLINKGTVPIEGSVALTAGDELQLYYDANGYTTPINLGSGSPNGIHWSVKKLN